MAACASPDTSQSWNDGSGRAAVNGYGSGVPFSGYIPGSVIEVTWDDREALGRIAYAEAGNQGQLGVVAVVYTIFNRVTSGQFQSSIQDVIDAPNQFEPATRVGGWRNLPPLSLARGIEFDRLLDQILAGNFPDPTNGALFFQNARIVAARAARGKGSWSLVDFGGTPPIAEIGDHRFYDWRAAINLAAARSNPSAAYYAQSDYSSQEVMDLNARSLDGGFAGYSVESGSSSRDVADLNAQSLDGSFGGYSVESDYPVEEVADLNARSLDGSLSAYYVDPNYTSQRVADLNARSLEGSLNE